MNFLNISLKKIIFLFCFLLLPVLAFPLHQPLQVGVMLDPPFDILTDDGYSGIAIDLWEAIALKYQWNYQYILITGTIDDALQQVHEGKLDILVDSIKVNTKRLKWVDFGRPFFIHNTAVTLPVKHNYWLVFREFLSTALLYIGGISLLCFFIYINLFWFFERGKNPKISLNYVQGISELLWVHLLKSSIGLPQTIYGRIMMLVWLTLTILVFSTYNASITSSLTVVLTSDKKSITVDELKQLHVAGIVDTLASDFAKREGVRITFTHDINQAFNLLKESKVDGVLSSSVIAQYYLQQNPPKQKYIVVPLEGEYNEAAFAVPPNSPLKRFLDLGLTELQDKRETTPICLRYLKSTEAGRCSF